MELEGKAERLLNQLIGNGRIVLARGWLGDAEKAYTDAQMQLALAARDTIHGKFKKLEKLVIYSNKRETDWCG